MIIKRQAFVRNLTCECSDGFLGEDASEQGVEKAEVMRVVVADNEMSVSGVVWRLLGAVELDESGEEGR